MKYNELFTLSISTKILPIRIILNDIDNNLDRLRQIKQNRNEERNDTFHRKMPRMAAYCDYKPYLTERGNVISTSILNYAMNQLMLK
jgi:hypothetical protein